MARRAALPLNPLAEYLKRHPELSKAELARKLEPHLRRLPSSASMVQWSSGSVEPRAEVRLALELATGGEIPFESWSTWQRARLELRSRRRAPTRSTG